MAIDTRDKRASSTGIGLQFLRSGFVPDGSIQPADRLHLDWLYRGIDAASPGPDIIAGPYNWAALGFHEPGAEASGFHEPGAVAGDFVVPGSMAGQHI